MDSHRTFEFDRYPFDDTPGERTDVESVSEQYRGGVTDISHGMEIDPPRSPSSEIGDDMLGAA